MLPMEPSMIIALALVLWWCLSIAVTIALKTLFTSAFLAFPYPFFVSGVINVLAALMAACYIYVRPDDTARTPDASRSVRRRNLAAFTRADWIQILSIGVVNGLALGAGNYYLKLLPVATRQMTHALTPVCMLVITVAFQLEALTYSLVLIMLVMSLGSVVSSINMIEEDAFGLGIIVHSPWTCVLFVASLCLYGAKWSCTQKMLQGRRTRTMSPVWLFACTAPVTAIVMLIMAFLVERRFWSAAPSYAQGTVFVRDVALCAIIAATAVGVCIMSVAENALAKHTSALSISVFASVHNFLIVLSGVIIFGDKITVVSLGGYALNQVGVAAYAYKRRQVSLQRVQVGDTNDASTCEALLGEHK